jgi:hypothetical protein
VTLKGRGAAYFVHLTVGEVLQNGREAVVCRPLHPQNINDLAILLGVFVRCCVCVNVHVRPSGPRLRFRGGVIVASIGDDGEQYG